MRYVFVHGRAQGEKSSDALRHEWLGALARGCAAAGVPVPAVGDVAVPFYGADLDRYCTAYDRGGDGVMTRGDGDADPAYAEFRSTWLEETRTARGISDAAVQAELAADVLDRGPLNWEWVQALLRAIDKASPGMSGKFIDRFTHDVWVYLTAPGVRDAIDRIVASALTAEPTVLVAHSLGTVVTYSVLRRHPELSVPRLITLGSPLGIAAIRRKFIPLEDLAVGDWLNAWDERDVVALRPLERAHYGEQLRNRNDVDNRTDNHHGIVHYLDDPGVARTIVAG